jgi:hypothetical protein
VIDCSKDGTINASSEGKRSSRARANILKYCALEVVIILFAAEDLKNFVVEAIRVEGRSFLKEAL